ncbi:transglutaminase family protein [Changchengzhania lutea]|uniref:transglutaminase family protein n=1 Tax=Changchengzhania lutea TaxID=2049305 RepID=UPI00115E669D|nr:transglutaminase family protein [Changchengzhania lutea]
MPTYYIKHLTKYSYSNFVIDGANQIMLYPIVDDHQKVINQKITVSNNPKIETYTDFYGNTVGSFMNIEPHNHLSITSEIEVLTTEKLFPQDTVAVDEQWEALKTLKNNIEFINFLKYKSFDGTEAIFEFIANHDLTRLTPFKIVLEFCEYIYKKFTYSQGITTVDSKLDDVWKLKAGVCQDFANILLQMVRMLGIPARYVSGYICPNDANTRGEGATHAWIEAYIPFYGWIGIDPTNNAIASDHHVKLAVGRHYADCAPVKGVFKGDVDDELFVMVKVSTKKNSNDGLVFPVSTEKSIDNSYRLNLELVQQQQQQQ